MSIEWYLDDATDYIQMNTLDNEDFLEAEDERKYALLNVAYRTLNRKFDGYIIPTQAVYIFAAVLGAAYNDTNKYQQQGVASFSVRGIAFTFKDWAKKGLDDLIPEEVYEMIGAPKGRIAKWTVL
ncbi:hypothetical protein [Bacillus chungangensis]|uniref:Kynureninase n=1 Tax=Bacillus chungangensis TaxID=587633 RepID=A0ABT9WM68_9BACI|nr:hypothetical protein [Bacillus chungangensis]MDQ0174382.1 kynureninase [Bacillus chungangensis]